MAKLLANLERYLKLVFVFALVLVRESNGSSCLYCDTHNVFGFPYEIDCGKLYESDKSECNGACFKPGCKCKGGFIDDESLTVDCDSGCGVCTYIFWSCLIIGILGIIACVLFFCMRSRRNQQQQMGYGMGGNMQQVQGAYFVRQQPDMIGMQMQPQYQPQGEYASTV